ncbi:co-chaperone protein HscB homolog isoform X1 [Panulirus ornatus]|uniref:co-chaperone protein HscB homolog isoform X1 n=1 Tax=Panulirus ornatus TaxID=150431 RepID=UPI003A8B48E2
MAMLRLPVIAQRGITYSVLESISTLWYSKCTYILGKHHLTKIKKQQNQTLCRNCVNENLSQPNSVLFPMKFCSNSDFDMCWSCETKLLSYTPFCDTCKILQPLNHHLNYFELLGIEKAFNLDTKSLTRTFRKLQSRFHPDKFSLRTEKEQQYALEHSSAVNKAYRCILHPVERALYLLELAGQPLHEGQLDMDPAFLMEIMEVNEELAEANDKDTVKAIGQRNQEILNGLLREADAAFSANDIETARNVVAKIKYYNNIYEKVQDYEREHGIIY